MRQSKDPTIFMVLFEDTAAVIGLVIALVGIATSQVFGRAELDGAASIGIGLLLGVVAIVLARESKGLLIGEAAASEGGVDPRNRAGSAGSRAEDQEHR